MCGFPASPLKARFSPFGIKGVSDSKGSFRSVPRETQKNKLPIDLHFKLKLEHSSAAVEKGTARRLLPLTITSKQPPLPVHLAL